MDSSVVAFSKVSCGCFLCKLQKMAFYGVFQIFRTTFLAVSAEGWMEILTYIFKYDTSLVVLEIWILLLLQLFLFNCFWIAWKKKNGHSWVSFTYLFSYVFYFCRRVSYHGWRIKNIFVVLGSPKVPGNSSSHSQIFKIGVLKSFTNFAGKHLCWSLFLIRLLAWGLKRDSNTCVFL